jgi:hypothetical protein
MLALPLALTIILQPNRGDVNWGCFNQSLNTYRE